MSSPAIYPVDRRRVRTRHALITAGHKLFAQRAVDAVTIDDIIEAADVAKGSFYNHFDDKNQLVNAIVTQVQQECENAISRANQDVTDPAMRMARALCVTMKYGHANPDRLQALISLSQRRTIAESPLNAGVAADVKAGIGLGQFSGVTLETGILLALGVIGIAVRHAESGQSAALPAELARLMASALLRSLGVAEPEAGKLASLAVSEILDEEKSR